MKPSKEQKVLSDYSEALSNLNPEEQFKKTRAVTSHETIRRFLSDEAPDQLVHRFAPRIDEDIASDMSEFEIGRVMFEVRNFNMAFELFAKALERGDGRAHYYLGVMSFERNDFESAGNHFHHCVKNGYRDDRAAIYLADMDLMYGDSRSAMDKLTAGYRMTPGVLKIYFAYRISLLMGSKGNAENDLKPLLETGDRQVCFDVIRQMHGEDNLEGVIKTFEKMARNGYLHYYVDLAAYLERRGELDKAAHYYRKAIDAGYGSIYQRLVELLVKQNRTDDAVETCKEAISKGNRGAYPALFGILLNAGRNDEMLVYVSKALYDDLDQMKATIEAWYEDDKARRIITRIVISSMTKGIHIHPLLLSMFLDLETEQGPQGPLN